MKKLLLMAVLCGAAACSTTVPTTDQGSGPNFAAGVDTQSSRISSGSLPFTAEKSKSFLRTGRPLSEESAAFQAFRSGDPWKFVQPHELVSLGKFRLRMRSVRIDNRDFVVAEMASNNIGAGRFDLSGKTLRAAQGKTECTVTGRIYNVRDSNKSGMVLPLAC